MHLQIPVQHQHPVCECVCVCVCARACTCVLVHFLQCVSAGDGKTVKWSRKFVDLFPKKYVCVQEKLSIVASQSGK